MLVCKEYDDDWENYTELDTDDLQSVADNSYDYFQLWPIENAQHPYQDAFDAMAGHPLEALDKLTVREGRKGGA